MAKGIPKEARTAETAETKAGVAQESPKEGQRTLQESVYPASELAANAKKVFGTRQECVAAALKAAGKTECTVTEAKGIVGKFLKREVK